MRTLRRIWCLLNEHSGLRLRKEWEFSGRIVWVVTCHRCGLQLAEGNSDGWIIPDWVAREFLENSRATLDWLVADVLRG